MCIFKVRVLSLPVSLQGENSDIWPVFCMDESEESIVQCMAYDSIWSRDKLILWSRENHGGIDWSAMIWVKQHSKIVSPSTCLSLSHGCICDCMSSPQEQDRLHQASLFLLTLSSLPDRYRHRRVKCNSLLTKLISSCSATSESIYFSQCCPLVYYFDL